MNKKFTSTPVKLEAKVEQLLTDLVEAARQCFHDDLRSVVLFGSGAEGRLRNTSDLNVMFILKRFDQRQVDAFREPLRLAHISGPVSAMFVLESELPAAVEAFAAKFDDISRRRRLLYGEDVLDQITIPPTAKKRQLHQILMNLALRLRERYAVTSLREERLALVIAEVAGPLRSAAATLLELEGQPAASPKAALEQIAQSMGDAHWPQTLNHISLARETRALPAGVAGPVLFHLMALVEAMRLRAERLR